MNTRHPRSVGRRWASRSALCLHLTAVAVFSAMAIGTPQRVLAQDVSARIDLPAQSLDSALIQLARQTSLQFFYAPDTVAGLASPAVQGEMTPEQALQRLLQGSGVTYSKSGRNITLSRPLSGATQLAPVQVSGEFDAVTEGTGSYTMPAAATATGMDLTLRETPQTISVITRQQMDDQNLSTLNEIVKATPGMNTLANGVGANDTRYHARGFPVENMMIDGMPMRLDGFSMPAGDMVMYDHVEVVRGAPGLTAGTGNPSAVISLVRKRPTRDFQFHGTLSAGSWDRYGATADVSGPINEAGTLRARVAGSWQDARSFVDVVHDRNRAIYGIIEADLSERTTLALGASYQNNHTQGVMWGLPVNRDGALLDYARSTFYGAPWSWAKRRSSNVFAELSHEFANGWQAKASWMSTRSLAEYLTPFYWLGATYDRPYVVDQVFGGPNAQNEIIGSFSVTGTVDAFGRQHDLAFGGDWRRRNDEGSGGFDGLLVQPGWMSVLDPSYMQNLPGPGDVTLSMYDPQRVREQSLYAAGRFRLTDRLSTVLGARLTWYHFSTTGSEYRLRNEVTPYAGLVLDLDDVHSVYVSYTSILQPQSTLDADGNVLKPISGTNMEVGIKGEYLDGALNTSLALFEIRQRNRAMADENGPSPCPSTGATLCQRAAGEIKTQGVDIGVAGRLATGWEMSAGYTFVKSRYVKDSVASNIGQPFNTRLPRHQFKLFTTYRLPGDWHRWTLGASLYAQSSMYNGTSIRIEQGGYWTAGMMLRYDVNSRMSVRLNVENLFNRRYYEALGYARSNYSSNNWYGAPRNAMLTMSYRM